MRLLARLFRLFESALSWYGNLSIIQQALIAIGLPLLPAGSLTLLLHDQTTLVALIGVSYSVIAVVVLGYFAVAYVVSRQPLDLEVQLQRLATFSFTHPNRYGATGMIGIPDLFILSNERNRLVLKISVRSAALGNRDASIEHWDTHLPGMDGTRLEIAVDGNAAPPESHLPADIPLNEGDHVRGCTELLVWTLNGDAPDFGTLLEGLEVVIMDRRSRRSWVRKRRPGGQPILGIDVTEEEFTPTSILGTATDQP